MSSAQENKAVSRRVAEEIFNGGNLDLADELYAPARSLAYKLIFRIRFSLQEKLEVALV